MREEFYHFVMIENNVKRLINNIAGATVILTISIKLDSFWPFCLQNTRLKCHHDRFIHLYASYVTIFLKFCCLPPHVSCMLQVYLL